MARTLPDESTLRERIGQLTRDELVLAATSLSNDQLFHATDLARGFSFLSLDDSSLDHEFDLGLPPNPAVSHYRALALALRLNRDLDRAIARSLALGLARELDLELARALDRDLQFRIDSNNTTALDGALNSDLQRTLDLDIDLIRDLDRHSVMAATDTVTVSRLGVWGALRIRAWWYQVAVAWAVSEGDERVKLERSDSLESGRARELPQSVEALTQLASNMLQDDVWAGDTAVESRVQRVVTYLTDYQRFPALDDEIEQRRAEGMVAQLSADIAAVAERVAPGVGAAQIGSAAKELSRIDGSTEDAERAENAVEALRKAEDLLLEDSDVVNESLDYTEQTGDKQLDGATLATAFGTAAGLALAGPTGAELGAAALGSMPAGAAIGGIGGVLLAGATGGKAGKQLADAVASIIAVTTRALAAILRRFRPKDSNVNED